MHAFTVFLHNYYSPELDSSLTSFQYMQTAMFVQRLRGNELVVRPQIWEEDAMKVLLVNPEFPETYWSFRHALPFEGKRCVFPPLSLMTVSGLLPRDLRASPD